MKSSIPDILVVLGYDGIYSDYKSVNAHDLLKNIPTLSVLHLSLIHISEPTRLRQLSRMPSSA